MPFSLGLSCSSRFLMNSLDTNFTKNRGITLNQVLVVSVNLNVQMNKNMCLFQFCIEIFKTYIQNFEKILLVTTLVKHFSIEGINGKRISRKRFSILLGRQYFCVKLNHCQYSKHQLHRFCFCHRHMDHSCLLVCYSHSFSFYVPTDHNISFFKDQIRGGQFYRFCQIHYVTVRFLT